MAAITKRKNKIRVKQFKFGLDQVESAELKIGLSLESVGTVSSQLAGLVLSLVKFELIRRDAFERWRKYLNQVGLRLRDLIVYLNVLHDDDELVSELKHFYVKTKTHGNDKIEMLRQANELKERLIDKIKQVKVLNEFPIHKIRAVEHIVE